MCPGSRLARLKFQNGVRNGQAGVGRNDIDVVGLDRQVVRHFAHREGSGLGQQARQCAFPRRVEMLHHHEGHIGVCRQMLEQLRERLQTTGRRADTDDRSLPHADFTIFRHAYPKFTGKLCSGGILA